MAWKWKLEARSDDGLVLTERGRSGPTVHPEVRRTLADIAAYLNGGPLPVGVTDPRLRVGVLRMLETILSCDPDDDDEGDDDTAEFGDPVA